MDGRDRRHAAGPAGGEEDRALDPSKCRDRLVTKRASVPGLSSLGN